MKSFAKKSLSIILALVLAFTASAVAFAASDDDVTPVIVISGMNAYPLYDEDDNTVFPMSTDVLLKDVPQIAGSVGLSLATMSWDGIAKYGLPAIADLFAGMACDETGESVNDLHTTTFPEALSNYSDEFASQETNQQGVARAIADEIGWDNVYFMHYDWRTCPMDLADDLDTYVQKAMSECGSDKVSLVPMSFGGTIVNSYIAKYGTDHIQNIVYASTAYNGVEMVGKLLSGDPTITLADVMVYMAAFSQNIDGLTDIVDLLASGEVKNDTLAEKLVNTTVNSLIDNLKTQVYSEIFGESLGHMKGLWCLMPDEYYESAKAYMKTVTTYSDDFFDEIDEYMEIQGSMRETFADLQSKGVNVYITGAYGYSGIPVTTGADKRTDTLIETYLMTGDSVVAPYGKTLDDVDYTKSGCTEHNHISTDNVVDASSCMLPEQTWFVKGIGHLKYDVGTRACDLLVWLATSEESLSVHSSEEYPQFFQMDKNSGVATSLTDGVTFDEQATSHWYDYIFDAFRAILNIIKKILNLPTLN